MNKKNLMCLLFYYFYKLNAQLKRWIDIKNHNTIIIYNQLAGEIYLIRKQNVLIKSITNLTQVCFIYTAKYICGLTSKRLAMYRKHRSYF